MLKLVAEARRATCSEVSPAVLPVSEAAGSIGSAKAVPAAVTLKSERVASVRAHFTRHA
jgi:hypothetical protein